MSNGSLPAVPAFERVSFDVARFPFAEVAAAGLGVSDLRELPAAHRAELSQREGRDAFVREDNDALRARFEASSQAPQLAALYHQLAREVLVPHFHGRLSHTASASFRVHLPGTRSVSDWHRDADHTRRPDYLNGWVPFIDVDEVTALWIEPDYDAGRPEPVPVRYGEILVFDGAFLRHGSVANTSDRVRVSMDFRFVPRSDRGRALAARITAGRTPEVELLLDDGRPNRGRRRDVGPSPPAEDHPQPCS